MAAELDLPPETDFARTPALQRLLVLEGVQDPGNMVRQQLAPAPRICPFKLPLAMVWAAQGHATPR